MRRVWISDMTSLMVMISFARSSSVLPSSGCADRIGAGLRSVVIAREKLMIKEALIGAKFGLMEALAIRRTFCSIATLMIFIANVSRVFLSRTRLTTAKPPVPRVSSTS